MKKKLLTYFALALGCAFFVACGSKTSDVKVLENPSNVAQVTDVNEKTAGYVFSYKGTAIPVDADAAPILEILGEPNSYFESPSCAAQGIGKLYTFNDFEIETYPDGDTDKVLYVLLKTDAVSTAEGISLSSSKDEVRAAYGEPTEEKTGAMNYISGDMTLKFIFDGEDLISIEYDSPKN